MLKRVQFALVVLLAIVCYMVYSQGGSVFGASAPASSSASTRWHSRGGGSDRVAGDSLEAPVETGRPRGGARGVRKPAVPAAAGALGAAPPPFEIPGVCFDGVGFHLKDDSECYVAMANVTTREVAEDPHKPYCWGTSGLPAETTSEGAAVPALLFHSGALTGLPASLPLLLWSFLATQCCDAVMWFWLPPHLAPPNASFFDLPPAHAHRIVWKTLVLTDEWAAVAGDFPAANASTVAAMSSWDDLRYITDWFRLVLMYRYGGVWVDIDTLMLHDQRPVLRLPSTSYRAGYTILMNNAYIKVARRPDALSQIVLARALELRDPRPDALSDTLQLKSVEFGVKVAGYKREGWVMLSQVLFDFIWLRFLDEDKTPALRAVLPDFPHAIHWDGFFVVKHGENRTSMEAAPFLPGSLAYHWHNRYSKGVPEGSWAYTLLQRFKALALEKVCPLSAT